LRGCFDAIRNKAGEAYSTLVMPLRRTLARKLLASDGARVLRVTFLL
jgi:hypothetical protein